PHAAGGAGFAIDVALAALLLVPPTVLMGGTIPILTQALARDLRDATRFHAYVYAFNTAGAFAGPLAPAFFLLPPFGLPGTLVAMGCVNLGAGGVFAWLGRAQPRTTAATPRAVAAVSAHEFWPLAVVAFLCGFAMMCVQTVLNRLGALALGASHFTFAIVVATFVSCIALGSFVVSVAPRVRDGAAVVAVLVLAATLLGLYRFLGDAPYFAHELRLRFGHEARDFMPYWLAVFGWTWLVFLVPIGISGAVLPLLFHAGRRAADALRLAAGRLFTSDTPGSPARAPS